MVARQPVIDADCNVAPSDQILRQDGLVVAAAGASFKRTAMNEDCSRTGGALVRFGGEVGVQSQRLDLLCLIIVCRSIVYFFLAFRCERIPYGSA